jgi:RNA polymerase sigma-70 factor (ECF subfamily)
VGCPGFSEQAEKNPVASNVAALGVRAGAVPNSCGRRAEDGHVRLLPSHRDRTDGEPTAISQGATSLDLAVERDSSGHAGFEQAFVTYRGPIYGYVRRMVSDDADAEDLTVTVFEKALKAWDRRPPEHELRPWLFRIATNACLDELRRRKRIQWSPWETFIGLFHPSQVAPDNPERDVLRKEKGELVRAALDKLSPRYRAALVMRECQGLSHDEIGEALGTTRDGAKMTLFRAREQMRAVYLQIGGEAPQGGRWSPARDPEDGSTARKPR